MPGGWVHKSGSSLSVREGEEIEFGCETSAGYPEPDISITSSSGSLGRGRLEETDDGGWVMWVKYTGNVDDDGATVVCTITQASY